MNARSRCFLCGARALAPTTRILRYPGGHTRRFATACGFCGMLADADADPASCLRHLTAAMAGDTVRSAVDAPYGFDAYTLRTAATRWSRAAFFDDPRQEAGLLGAHGELAGAARLADLSALPPVPVSLGILCRPADVARLREAYRPHASWAAAIVILADGNGEDEVADGTVRLRYRPLGEDFAAQRNALQDLSRAPWILQLDSDETLDPGAGALLPHLAALAERSGARSIGLPRRNLVGGVLADLYPDTQYRLNRREIRFAGRVHERPVRPWQESFVALCLTIDHHLSPDHVARRSRAYEAIEPGRGRLEEEAALSQPFRA